MVKPMTLLADYAADPVKSQLFREYCDRHGRIKESEIPPPSREYWMGGRPIGVFLDCPSGECHHAFRGWVDDGLGRCPGGFVFCGVCNRGWLVVDDRKPVGDTIQGEEASYIDLLENSEPVVRKHATKRGWSDETRRFLYETHGIPADVYDAVAERTKCEQPGG